MAKLVLEVSNTLPLRTWGGGVKYVAFNLSLVIPGPKDICIHRQSENQVRQDNLA